MAHEWNIRPRGRCCNVCDTRFDDGQECVSTLFASEAGYDRLDYCLPCWEKRTDSRTPFSLWQGAFARPPESSVNTEPMPRETAESLLRRLVALEDPANANVVYILAVMLERKKQLVERDTKPREGGGILRVYEHRPSGDTFVVLDPQLRLDEIGAVQQQVIAMLSVAPAGAEPVAVGEASPPPGASGAGRHDFDVVLRGGRMLDGSGTPARLADIGIRDGRIVLVGQVPDGATSGEELDVSGQMVAPGFIDVHSHSDAYLLVEPDAPSKVRQGVTTEVVGQCGCSAAPLQGAARHPSDWQAVLAAAGVPGQADPDNPWRSLAAYREALAARGHAPNVVALAGHNTLRAGVMGYAARTATADEVREIGRRLEQAIDEGAAGFSTGLIYVPGRYSHPDEVLALARVAAARGAWYATHMRSEGAHLEAAVEEVLALARATGVRTQISHLKTAGRKNWHKVDDLIRTLNAARAEGLAVHVDRYPYCVSGTSLDSRLPGWAQADGNAAILARLNDRETATRIAREIEREAVEESGTWNGIMIGGTAHPELTRFRGQTVSDVARAWSCAPVEAYLQILRLDALYTEAFFSSMSEANMVRIYAEPWVMVGSDASIRATSGPLSEDHPHPRCYGAFARFLKLAIGGKLAFGVEEAVRRMTALPADALGLKGRGRIVEGAWADLTVFEPDRVKDLSTFANPHRYAAGFTRTIVNGRTVFDGQAARERSGRWLTGGG